MDRHLAAAPYNAIDIEGLSHSFANLRAIGPIDLAVPSGQFLAILGPSGCGKSTLLRLIAGLLSPTDGAVETDNRRTGFVFQDSHLLPWRTVLDNVRLPAELEGNDATEHARDLLKEVGLSDFAGAYPNELSGGMRMRVSLARALVTTPELLLLDEPFAALDEITRQELDDMLRRLSVEHAMTTVFVTHSVAEAAYLSERAVVLSPRPGRVVLDVPIELPAQRDASLRGTAEFARQTALLFEALRSDVPGEAVAR
ncbi:MAG: ABC transporter ATP-binding protein [Planctomycetota bacterium]